MNLTRNLSLALVALCITALFMATPVLAGTKYMTGSPDLTLGIVGNNEFSPGTTVPLELVVQNTGLNQMKFVQSGIVDSDDIPNTAKMVTVSLTPGEAPVLIKSDAQMIGDVEGSQSATASFNIRIPDDAKAGTYTLPVTLDYTYLANAEQQGTDSVVYRYNTKSTTYDLPFVVKSAINLAIADVRTDAISAGGSGFVTLSLENTGADAGENAIAKLVRNGESPVIPVDSNVFMGTFAPGEIIEAKFKVSVSESAEPQDYPLSVSVTYENADGETIDSPTKEFGIPVGPKVDFTITSPPPEIRPGEKNTLEVTYRNDGAVTVYGAEARLSAVDPFSSDDDLAYLGDINPGETGTAYFKVTVESGATIKTYGLDSEVKYRDALDESQISDTIKIPITVTPNEGLGSVLGNPIVIAAILMIILGAGYYLYSNRKAAPIR